MYINICTKYAKYAMVKYIGHNKKKQQFENIVFRSHKRLSEAYHNLHEQKASQHKQSTFVFFYFITYFQYISFLKNIFDYRKINKSG